MRRGKKEIKSQTRTIQEIINTLYKGVGEIILLCDTINFHKDIVYDNVVMTCTRTALEIYQREVTPKICKEKQSFLYVT